MSTVKTMKMHLQSDDLDQLSTIVRSTIPSLSNVTSFDLSIDGDDLSASNYEKFKEILTLENVEELRIRIQLFGLNENARDVFLKDLSERCRKIRYLDVGNVSFFPLTLYVFKCKLKF